MDFDGADALDDEVVVDRLRTDPGSLSRAGARSVATTLLADGAFSEPYCEWMPLWYEFALLVPVRYCDWRLRRVAREVAADAGVSVSAPRFSRPVDVTVRGDPALAGVSGFRDRFLLAAALVHLEWFVHAARADGIHVPAALVARTREETLAAYATGESTDRSALSPDARRFQRLLFTDDAWVREVNDAYGLNSRLFGVWVRLLREERERLASETGPEADPETRR